MTITHPTSSFEELTEGQQNIVIDAASIDVRNAQDFDHAEYLYAKLPAVQYGCVGIDVIVRYSGRRIRIERYSDSKTLGIPCYRVKANGKTIRKGFFMGESEVLGWLSMLQEVVYPVHNLDKP